jgi:hypothetical protein
LKAEAVVIAKGIIFADILEAQPAAAQYKKTVLVIPESLEVRSRKKCVSGYKKKRRESGIFLLTMSRKTIIFFLFFIDLA